MAAGIGKYGTSNSAYYLYNPHKWSWTISPNYCSNYSVMITLSENGSLSSFAANNSSGGVVSVINLTSEYFKTLIGTGTMEDPFREKGLEP